MSPMRDFRDAKTMAQTLRDSLIAKTLTISHSESLELVSKMLGVADWNTLSALLHADRRETASPAAKRLAGTLSYPAIPLRDLVPFPTVIFPLFIGRAKTMQALDHAFERQREVVLVVQKESAIDEPGFDDLYEIGVIARLLELERLSDKTLKVLAQVHRRVVICRFVGETGAYQAEIADISEGPIPDAPELIQRAVKRFESYAAARDIRIPQIFPPLDKTRDPGRVADIIASYMVLPIGDKQRLLATLDPVARLEDIDGLMIAVAATSQQATPVARDNAVSPAASIAEGRAVLPLSIGFAATLHQALAVANARKHEYCTLEHLLLALIEDADASAVMSACNADSSAIKQSLVSYLDNELKRLVIDNGGDAKPTAAFQRVLQRAERHAQGLGTTAVTGANILLAIFPETRSPAARLLSEQGMSAQDAANFIARDTVT
jgi:ATP-dependent Lon protease